MKQPSCRHTHTHTHDSRFKWRSRLRLLWQVALSAVIGMAAAPDHVAAQCESSTCTGDEINSYSIQYRIIDLGDIGVLSSLPWPPNADTEGTLGLNELGVVVYAERDSSGNYDPWVWLPRSLYGLDEGRHSLPSIDHLDESPTNAIPREVNDAGVIVGQSASSGSPLLDDTSPITGAAIVWYLDDNMGSYATFTSFNGQSADGAGATAVSDTDPPVMVGMFSTTANLRCHCNDQNATESVFRAFALTLGGSAVVYAPSDLDDATQSYAWDISSDSTDRVGVLACDAFCPTLQISCMSDDCISAALFPSQVRLESIVQGLSADQNNAYGVNNAGQTVGRVGPPNEEQVDAAFWEPASTTCPCMLGEILPEGSAFSRAVAINNKEYPQVVGWETELNEGLLWEQQSNESWLVTNLELVIEEDNEWRWRQLRAHDINDKGWIAGVGLYCAAETPTSQCTGERESHAFLLVPKDESAQCAGDADGNGVVDVLDLLAALENWDMECVVGVGPPLCIGDANADGIVDVFDLLDILDNWGQCDTGSPPASLESLLVAAGLPSDADDDYLDILTNGTQAEKDNYNCWVEHYLTGCGALCQYQCPDDDPWGHH